MIYAMVADNMSQEDLDNFHASLEATPQDTNRQRLEAAMAMGGEVEVF